MRVASWNVNSVKARLDRLIGWLNRHQPDILCLQELKVVDDKFPHIEVQAAGYRAVVHGQKTYNGVAILSRQKPQDVTYGLDDGIDDQNARVVAATIGDVRTICVYVPNGKEVGSDPYAYKLRWLQRLKAYLQQHHRPDERLVVCGDFNCAPEDKDVNRLAQWGEGVLTHPDVRKAVANVTAWGLIDTFRKHNQQPGFYSWWDYRMLGFPKNNGLRIDMVFATAPLAERCTEAWMDRQERKGNKPSDHVPVVAEFS